MSGTHLNTRYSTQHQDSSIEDSQSPLNLDREIDVT